MSWWKRHDRPIPRPDLIHWDPAPHGWTGNKFGPTKDKTVRPVPEQAPAHRLRSDPEPMAPIDPWREARQHFAPLIASARKSEG